MMIDTSGMEGGIEVLWNPNQVIFEDWIGTCHTLSETLQPVRSDVWCSLIVVYDPSTP